jgi:hypothetical protein
MATLRSCWPMGWWRRSGSSRRGAGGRRLAKGARGRNAHRDPAGNIMVTRDGFVKIRLGLAKLTQPQEGDGGRMPRRCPRHFRRGRDGDGGLHVAGAGRESRSITGPTSSLSMILYDGDWQGVARSGSVPETLTAIICDEPEPIGNLSPLAPAAAMDRESAVPRRAPTVATGSTRDMAQDVAAPGDRIAETSSGGGRGERLQPAMAGRSWLVGTLVTAALRCSMRWRPPVAFPRRPSASRSARLRGPDSGGPPCRTCLLSPDGRHARGALV